MTDDTEIQSLNSVVTKCSLTSLTLMSLSNLLVSLSFNLFSVTQLEFHSVISFYSSCLFIIFV